MGRVFDLESKGVWTPTLTFTTPGDLAITATYSGQWWRRGAQAKLDFSIVSSSFVHSTASGNLIIGGIPANLVIGGTEAQFGFGQITGVTKAGYGEFIWRLLVGNNTLNLISIGSGVAAGIVAAADMPSGGTVVLRGSIPITI